MKTIDQHHRLSDPAEIRELSAVYGWDMRHMRLGAGSLGVSAWVTRAGDLVLYREYFEFPVVATGISSPDDFSVLTIQKGRIKLYGDEVSQQQIGLFPPGARVEAIGQPDLETFHVQISGARLLAEARKEGVELVEADNAFAVTPGLDRIRHLRQVMLEASAILESGDTTAWKRTEKDLLALLLAVFDRSTISALKLPKPIKPGPSHALEVQRRVDLLLPDEVDPDTLAHELGISRRHLNRCFKDYYGVSLKDYLRIRRLYEARGLLQDSVDQTSVTDVAYSCGFAHLGRFSAEYKRLFGESPRQTLNHTDRVE